MRIDKNLVSKYLWIPLTVLLVISVSVIGILASRKCSTRTECINMEGQNVTTYEENKCDEDEITEVLSSYNSLETVEKIENDTSYGVVITVNEEDIYGNKTGQCKYYITDIIQNGLGISNDQLSSLRNIIYLNSGYVAYAYKGDIYVQEIKDGSKPVLVAGQNLASNTSLDKNGEIILIDGPYIANEGSRSGISNTDQFFFSVDFVYGCELDTPKEHCDQMGVLLRELEEKNIVGWWLYKGNQSKQIVHLGEN